MQPPPAPQTAANPAAANPAAANQTVTEADLEKCLDILARLIDGPRPQYLPLYIRLESELEKLRAEQDAMSRVRRRRRASNSR